MVTTSTHRTHSQALYATPSVGREPAGLGDSEGNDARCSDVLREVQLQQRAADADKAGGAGRLRLSGEFLALSSGKNRVPQPPQKCNQSHPPPTHPAQWLWLESLSFLLTFYRLFARWRVSKVYDLR